MRTAPTLDDARRTLKAAFGYDAFLLGQAEALEAVLAGEDVFAVMPTGSGKSLLYQLPAAMGVGLVVVVSPLIALMRDQLRAVADTGVVAAALHSAQGEAEAAQAHRALARGRAQLLYVAPERLALESTIDLLKTLPLRLFVVDEAHCISQWGHEFRPDYAQLGAVRRRLGAPPTLAVTATAGPRTRGEVSASLFARPPRLILRSFARPNLALAFRPRGAGLRQIADFIARRRGQSGIVYCSSRRKADIMARDLRALGFDALAYHAGLDPATRSLHQDAFFERAGVVMVATIAFGMGVDKHDVRYVLHADLPDSIEGYYQEIGRAGRDGAPAEALALFDRRDLAQRWSAPAAIAHDEAAVAEHGRRKAMAALCVTPGCRTRRLLAAFGEDSAPCGTCDACRGGLLTLPRRLGALALGLRAALESRVKSHIESGAGPEPDAAAPAPNAAQHFASEPPPEPMLRVGDERLLRELLALRLALAKARGVPPNGVASAEALQRLAMRSGPAAFAAQDAGAIAPADRDAFLRVVENSRQQ